MAKGKGGKESDPPMSPGDQAEVDRFYQKNRSRMDQQNPVFHETRRGGRAERREDKQFEPKGKKK